MHDRHAPVLYTRSTALPRCQPMSNHGWRPPPFPSSLQQIMRKFAMETERMDMTQEMMGDTIDDVMEEASDEEEEEKVVDQVLTELGIDAMEDVRVLGVPPPVLARR